MTDSSTRPAGLDALLDGIDDLPQTAHDALRADGSPGELRDTLADAGDVADEVEDLLGTVDLTDLVDAVDWESVPDAVELDDVPDAVADRDPTAAVELRELLSVTSLPDIWRNVDVREFWRQSRDLDDAIDDLELAGALESAGGDSDGGDTAPSSRTGPSAGPIASGGYDAVAVENTIQSEVSEAVGEFRQQLLDARQRLQGTFEANRDRSGATASSRNPTAVSTMPAGGSTGSRPMAATVPEETRYSTAPNRQRIYGSRFPDGERDE